MEHKHSLNGIWNLYYYSVDDLKIQEPSQLATAKISKIPATVPGNVELDLAEAGIIDKELYQGMTTQKNEFLEDYDWWYEKEFAAPETAESDRVFLQFGAVDCIADYFLNGKKIHHSENAYMEIRIDITDQLHKDTPNHLLVHIYSTVRYAFEKSYPQYLSVHANPYGIQSYLRKPSHSFGWDIFPRAVSAGLWRDVDLVVDDGYNFEDFSYMVLKSSPHSASLRFMTSIQAPYQAFKKKVTIRVQGVCGDSSFDETADVFGFKSWSFPVEIKKPKLWWPYGYGDPNVYDLTYSLYVDGELKDQRTMNMGIRTVELVRTPHMEEKDHCFYFRVNNTNIMCRGSNWVPLDAYHSRDHLRYEKVLRMFTDSHCNMVRVWGGGVYEQEAFYDYCDRHGIMVWQDIMGCIMTSMDPDTMENIRREVTWAVRKLRHHPALVLWCGDNEVDILSSYLGLPPDVNQLTRKLYPEILKQNDFSRPYLESSPYVPEEEFMKANRNDYLVENHLWGPRDYFKSDFYANSPAHFVSETGYHGCPCISSVKKIVDEDSVWPIFNEQWALHSSNQKNELTRVVLMEDQIKQLFDFKPDNLEDFVLASQISQAEADKFFMESIRIKKPYTGGMILWNMMDGWPQMSDATVDYFFHKKLAYYYIKRAQQPVAFMIDEMKDWAYTLYVSNDTLEAKSGSYRVYDIDTNEILVQDTFTIDRNDNVALDKIPMYYPDQRFLVIEWEIDSVTYYNHHLCGMPGFDFAVYKGWLAKFNEITGDPDTVA